MCARRSFDDVIKLNKIALQGFGVLPLDGPPSKWKFGLSHLLALFALCCQNVLIGPMIHAVLFTPQEDPYDVLDILSLIVTGVGGQIRMLLMIVNRRKLQNLLSTCEEWWADASSTDHKIISAWGIMGVSLTKGLIYNATFSAFAYTLTPVIMHLTSSKDSSMRTLPFRIRMNTTGSPQYEIVYVVQAVAAQSCALTIIGCDVIVVVLILHVCGQLELIRNWLSDMSARNAETRDEIKSREGIEEALKKCIEKHRSVLDYCRELEELVSNMNLVTVLAWMYVVSLSTASLLRAGSYRSVTLICVGILQLFFLCWPAQTLSSKSFEIVNAAYSVPWYGSPMGAQTAVSFMITRAQQPASLTAGKYAVLSLETFSTILSNAVSFFMMLKTF